jgi:membrane protein implicated in regulation of membrane protease activity
MREWWRETTGLARALVASAAAIVVAGVLLIAAWLWLPAIGSPSGDAVRYSITREVGGSTSAVGLHTCETRTSGLLVCEVADVSSSGFARYRVRLDGRCWRARKVSPDHWEEQIKPMKRRASGCVEFRDQLRFYERAI